MQVFAMTKNYNINQVVKTLTIVVDIKESEKTKQVYFEFLVNIIKLSEGKHAVQAFRSEIYELKPIDGDISHEAILVRDLFLVDDRKKFETESDAVNYVSSRLDELFG
jgi:hypothetical protein